MWVLGGSVRHELTTAWFSVSVLFLFPWGSTGSCLCCPRGKKRFPQVQLLSQQHGVRAPPTRPLLPGPRQGRGAWVAGSSGSFQTGWAFRCSGVSSGLC